MGIQPFTTDNNQTMLVDQTIGSAYKIVRHVSEHIEYIKHVSSHMAEIYLTSASMTDIEVVVAKIADIELLNANSASITAVAAQIDAVSTIYTNLAAILQVHGNLTELLNVHTNMAALLAVAADLTVIGGRVTAVENTLGEKIDSIVAGTNVTVDATDPKNPVISGTGDLISANNGSDFDDADTVLTNLGIYDFKTVPLLVADTTLTGLTAGTIVTAGGYRYEVVASGEHVTTAGGVKLYALPDSQGVISAAQFNVPFSPTVDGGLLQVAHDAAFDSGADFFIPEGHYLTTGIVYKGGDRRSDAIPGDDLRGKTFRVFGVGYGEPFVQTNEFGTCIRSVTDAPVYQDLQGPVPSSGGTLEIEGIRFDGTSTTPVVHLRHFYGLSRIRKFSVYQRGTGDGIKIEYAATVEVENGYAMNGDWLAAVGTAGARTGTAYNFDSVRDSGLFRFRGLTARGFRNGFTLDGAGGAIFKPEITNCECAFTFNGMTLIGVRGGTVTKNYFEGCDGGNGISMSDTNYTTVSDNFMFDGYAVGIVDNEAANFGNVIESNTVSLADNVGAVGIQVRSNANLKVVHKNKIIAQPGASGQFGILLEGTSAPRFSILDNDFDPVAWSTGAQIFNNTGVSLAGFSQALISGEQSQGLLGGFLTVKKGTTLTQANVVANKLTLPEGNYFDINASVATTVQIVAADNPTGKVVYLNLVNANTTFQSTAQLGLGGTNYSGPGILTLMLDKIGATDLAYEISRA